MKGETVAILFFDAETSGLPDFKRAPGPDQPHIVEIAAILVTHGMEETMRAVIRPDGWVIEEKAASLHGFTTERANKEGIQAELAMIAFKDLASRCEVIVAHNLAFDMLMVLSEFARLSMPEPFLGCDEFCTMKATTGICKLPGKYGYKWPKLSEAYKHFFGKDFDGAHGAMADALACRAVYEKIQKGGQ